MCAHVFRRGREHGLEISVLKAIASRCGTSFSVDSRHVSTVQNVHTVHMSDCTVEYGSVALCIDSRHVEIMATLQPDVRSVVVLLVRSRVWRALTEVAPNANWLQVADLRLSKSWHLLYKAGICFTKLASAYGRGPGAMALHFRVCKSLTAFRSSRAGCL